jgi:hypothetical protein
MTNLLNLPIKSKHFMREEVGISSMIKLVKRDQDHILNRQQLIKGILIRILYRQNN